MLNRFFSATLVCSAFFFAILSTVSVAVPKGGFDQDDAAGNFIRAVDQAVDRSPIEDLLGRYLPSPETQAAVKAFMDSLLPVLPLFEFLIVEPFVSPPFEELIVPVVPVLPLFEFLIVEPFVSPPFEELIVPVVPVANNRRHAG